MITFLYCYPTVRKFALKYNSKSIEMYLDCGVVRGRGDWFEIRKFIINTVKLWW